MNVYQFIQRWRSLDWEGNQPSASFSFSFSSGIKDIRYEITMEYLRWEGTFEGHLVQHLLLKHRHTEPVAQRDFEYL